MSGAIKLINELAPHSGKIIEFLAEPEGNDLKSDFAKDQIKEERLKAAMICNPKAENIIIKAESDEHFKGRIISLLLGGNAPEEPTAEKLQKRFDKFRNFLKNKDAPYPDLGRELLKYGDYTLNYCGNNWQFIVSKESLFYMLHNKTDKFYSNFIPAWTAFLDSDTDKKENPYEKSVWQYYFINYPIILNESSKHSGLFSWDGDFSCRLLKGDNKKGEHCCPYVMVAAKELRHKCDMWSSSRNALRGYTRFPEIGKEIKLQEQEGKVVVELLPVNEIETPTWDKKCDLIVFLKEGINKILNPQQSQQK
jgi:hypothetical protein